MISKKKEGNEATHHNYPMKPEALTLLPAPAIDLEEFSEWIGYAAASLRSEGGETDLYAAGVLDRLLALINGSPKVVSGTSQRIELTNGQISQLADFAGTPDPGTPIEDQDVIVILHSDEGHSGPGLYAYYDELQEEGAIHLDGEVQP